jgi:hypothetical protein
MQCILAEPEQVAEFGLDNLVEIVLTFVIAGIAISYGTSIQSDVRDDFTSGSLPYNVSTKAMQANESIAAKLPTLAKIMIAAMILTVLVTYMWMRK